VTELQGSVSDLTLTVTSFNDSSSLVNYNYDDDDNNNNYYYYCHKFIASSDEDIGRFDRVHRHGIGA